MPVKKMMRRFRMMRDKKTNIRCGFILLPRIGEKKGGGEMMAGCWEFAFAGGGP